MRLHENIVGVPRYFNRQNPWVNFDNPPTNTPQGMKIVVYLEAKENRGSGVYGDGILQADLYEVSFTEDGQESRQHVKNWAYDPEQASMFRGERTRLGLPYKLVLGWPELDLADKEIMIAISFRRKDGRLIKAQPVRMRVPTRV